MTESGTCLDIRDGETYEKWCWDHPQAYVANTPTLFNRDYFKVHRSSCGKISPKEKGDGKQYTEDKYYKVASESLEDLTAWGEMNGFDPTCCKICLRDVVLPGGEVIPPPVQPDISDGANPGAKLPSDGGAREAERHDAVIEADPGESAEVSPSAASVDARKEADGSGSADLQELARLLNERNEIGRSVTAVIGRPMLQGHVGEYIASNIFDIKLCESAVTPGMDGHFRSGVLAGRSVNVKFYPKHESILDIKPEYLPHYYLVLTGPRSTAASSKGAVRPWIVRHVFLFDAAYLVQELKERVKVGKATSVKRRYWNEAEIYPGGSSPSLVLSEEQRGLLKAFDGSGEEIQGG